MIDRKSLEFFALGFLAGWIGLLILKYWIIGLPQWDEELHPNRLPCDVPGG